RGKKGTLPKLKLGNRRRHAGLPMASDQLQPGSAPPKEIWARGSGTVVAGGYPAPADPPRARKVARINNALTSPARGCPDGPAGFDGVSFAQHFAGRHPTL